MQRGLNSAGDGGDGLPAAGAETPPDTEGARRRFATVVTLLVAGSLPVAVVSLWAAVSALGTVFPSLLVDPAGVVSGLALPAWSDPASPGAPERPTYPDAVVAVDGRDVAHGTGLPAIALRRTLASRLPGEAARLSFRRGATTFERTLRLRAVGTSEVIYLYGGYALVGGFLLWSGVVALAISRRRAGSRAYAATTAASFLFLATLFDYHTTTWLVPLFHVGRLGTATGCLWLAYSFPLLPRGPRTRRVLAALLAAASVLGVALVAAACAAPVLSAAWTLRAHAAADLYFFGAMLAVAGSVLGRLHGSSGRDRAELRSAAVGLVVAPALIGAGMWQGGAVFYLVLPLVIASVPLAIGYALIRHDILASSALLRRKLLAAPIAMAAALLTLLAWQILRQLLWPPGSAAPAAPPPAAPWLVALPTWGAFTLAAWRLSARLFYPTTRSFRPTVEDLSSELATVRDTATVRDAVERIALRWLPVAEVKVVESDTAEAFALVGADARDELSAGNLVWCGGGDTRQLVIPVRSQGRLRATMLIGPKREGGLFTADELELLRTIANLAAIGLHNATVIAELQAMRALESHITRRDKQLAIGVLGAEISHEMAYPLGFLRYVLRRHRRGQALTDTDVEVAHDEVERLERMLGTLRRLGPPAPRPTAVFLRPVVDRALALLREPIGQGGLTVNVTVPSDLAISADPDALLQAFANLLRNAVQAAGAGGHVGVDARDTPEGLALDVWDSGPGVPAALESTLFQPFVSGRAGGLGLGLAITHRIVRSLGWNISVTRADGRTRFRVLLEQPARPAGAATSPATLPPYSTMAGPPVTPPERMAEST